jgi:hypothetical protein
MAAEADAEPRTLVHRLRIDGDRLFPECPAALRLSMPRVTTGSASLVVASASSVGIGVVDVVAAARLARSKGELASNSDSKCTAPLDAGELSLWEVPGTTPGLGAELQGVSACQGQSDALMIASIGSGGEVVLSECSGSSLTSQQRVVLPDCEGCSDSFGCVQVRPIGTDFVACACHWESQRAHWVTWTDGAVVRSVPLSDRPLCCCFVPDAGESVMAVSEGACVSLFDVRVGERGGRVAKEAITSGGYVTGLSARDGLLAVGGTSALVSLLDVRKLKPLGSWSCPTKLGTRAVRLGGALPASTAPPRRVLFASGVDSDVSAGIGSLKGAAAPSSKDDSSPAAKKPKLTPHARPERKPVGSGPPGGDTGRLGLRQTSGFRAACRWVGMDVCAQEDGSHSLAVLGDDASVCVVLRAEEMLPSILL